MTQGDVEQHPSDASPAWVDTTSWTWLGEAITPALLNEIRALNRQGGEVSVKQMDSLLRLVKKPIQ